MDNVKLFWGLSTTCYLSKEKALSFIMPPPLPCGPLSALIRPNSQISTSYPFRAFTTSAALSFVGPESPKFIDVPLPPQRYASGNRDIKGKLPSPRDVFHRRGPTKDGRTLKQHLRLATLPPSKERLSSEPANERIAWKRRMADSRRQNLQDGIRALYERKNNQQRSVAARSHKKQQDRDARLNAPQREDERLTNPTVKEAVRDLQLGPVADPQRESRIAEMKQRVEAKEAAREEARQNALHTLYMHARSFIVTEEQLNAEVDRIFVEKPFPKAEDANVWEAFGVPLTIDAMVRGLEGRQKTVYESSKARNPAHKAEERMARISEEFTGGKLD